MFNGFKKIGEDDQYAYMKHPSGHDIRIAKNALSPKQRNQLAKLPVHKAEGGGDGIPNSLKAMDPNSPATPPQAQQPVTVNVAAAPTPAPAQNPAIWNYQPHSDSTLGKVGEYIGAYGVKPAVQSVKDTLGSYVDAGKAVYNGVKDLSGGVLQGAAPEAAAKMDALQQKDSAPAPDASSQPQQVDISKPGAAGTPGAASMGVPVRDAASAVQGYDTQMKGIQGEANALGAMSRAQAPIYHTAAQAYDNIAQQTMQNVQQNEARVNEILAQVKDAKIDPEAYQKSRTDAQRTNMAIGLILGGIGGGMTKTGHNPAMDILQENIKQNIDAQKANINNKYSVLNQYQQLYGNRADALKAMTATYAQQYSNQLQEAAAKQGTPLAQARAQQAIGPLQTLKNQMLYDISMRQAANQNFNSGNVSPADQVRFRSQIGEIPAGEQEKVMTAVDQVENLNRNRGAILSSFDKSNDENTLFNRAIHGGSEPASVGNLRAMLLPFLKDSAGRINETELAIMEGFIPKPGDGEGKIKEKRAGLEQWMQSHNSHTVLDRYRIHVPTPPTFQKAK